MSKRFQILSLDGGGIKGIFSAAILAAIEKDLSVKLIDHFDLIVGTSTGGIIALGLGLGLSPQQMVEFYLKKGPNIFAGANGIRSFQHWFIRKFPQSKLKGALTDPHVLGDKTLGQSTKRLVIPSYNLSEDDIYLFKTPHHKRFKRDWRVPAWEIALATSAAPTFFPASKHIDNVRHIDGGVWANNPIMTGIVEAVSVLDIPLEQINILSIGTSAEVTHRPFCLNSGGKLRWANHASDLIMRGQSIGAHTQAVHLLKEGRVTRIDPKVPNKLFTLDSAKMGKELLPKAAHESRKVMPIIASNFITHLCSNYEPYYGDSMSTKTQED